MGYLFNFDVNDGFFLIALFSWSVYYLGTGTKLGFTLPLTGLPKMISFWVIMVFTW